MSLTNRIADRRNGGKCCWPAVMRPGLDCCTRRSNFRKLGDWSLPSDRRYHLAISRRSHESRKHDFARISFERHRAALFARPRFGPLRSLRFSCRRVRCLRSSRRSCIFSFAWTSVEADTTHSVAWGDYDGDGDLDLAVGNSGQPNRLYRNDGGSLTANAVWSSAETDYDDQCRLGRCRWRRRSRSRRRQRQRLFAAQSALPQ